MRVFQTLTFAATLLASVSTAWAETHEVRMLNRGETGAMVFEPAFLQIAPGDSVRFVAAEPGHNAESIKDLIPEGAKPFKGRVNEEIEVTFEIEGAYAYKCAPHYSMGMVGLIVVGRNPANLDAFAKARLPPLALARYTDWLAKLRQ
ncbi:pseudoazurin [Agrobacterium rhizogenes]|uniref:Pseudoazurin n=1 Tax=Rhizobium rhizogenes NBRC 13257 TaxID=1220581 RepID=A0AA87QAY0_RHIRH|nr:pseudoazurin [Rhizobium rhizogenes]NTG65101.1 pseudoazurin [Rhizobium rhizogenes]NTG71552.1 pseudoazurin [Rhizobium rhizogenes]NTG84451.1 pseudoazurin [Rhizobium rhizogenes]NTG90845.1 pseudoazurin [Rhizobium rhizogenes]NTH29479.1 pseudoazurin [Rhizobium rhizogenes]